MTLAGELVKVDVVEFFTQYLEMKAADAEENSASLVRRITNRHRFFGDTHLDIDGSNAARREPLEIPTALAIDHRRASSSPGL